MFIEILIALLVGTTCGIFTGLLPGLHINLAATILLSLSSLLLDYFNPITLAVILVSMSITHTFLDFIPSILLGAPDSETALAVLPGHSLLLKGRAYEAIVLSVLGALVGFLFIILLIPLLIFIVPRIYNLTKDYIGWLLLLISVFMVLREKDNNKRFWSFLVFSLSGLLGLIVFSIPNLKEPLLPLLSGLFGVSMIICSIKNDVRLPEQEITQINVDKKRIAKPMIVGAFSSSLISIFPAVGPAQAAILASLFFGEIKAKSYLVMIGCINTVSMIFSIITLYTINKARNGPIVIVQEIIGGACGVKELILFILVSLVSAGIAVILSLFLSRFFIKIINRINYKKISICVMLLILVLVSYFSGIIGILILITATSIGMIPNLLGVGRNNSMGCLLVPVMLYFILY